MIIFSLTNENSPSNRHYINRPLFLRSSRCYNLSLSPELNFSYKLKNNFKLNFATASRQQLSEYRAVLNERSTYEYIHTDVTLDLSKKTGANTKFQLGYLVRYRGDEVIQRLRQRFVIISKLKTVLLCQRFSTEETFLKNKPVEYRFRYLISPRMALGGTFTDSKYFYLKATGEMVNAFEKQKLKDIDLRFTPNLGYQFASGLKLEIGSQYRYGKFLRGDRGLHRLFFIMSSYIKL